MNELFKEGRNFHFTYQEDEVTHINNVRRLFKVKEDNDGVLIEIDKNKIRNFTELLGSGKKYRKSN